MAGFTGYDVSITASIAAGFLMLVASFALIWKGVLKLGGAKGASS